jgi:WD40 repeat protein
MICTSRFRVFSICFATALLLVSALPALPSQNNSEFPVLTTFGGHSEPIYAVAASPDGKLVATGSWDKTVKLHDAATGSLLRTFAGPQGHSKMVLAVAFSSDGRQLASGGEDNLLKIWDVPSESPLRTLDQKQPLACLALSPDGAKVAVAGKQGMLKLFGAADFKETSSLVGHTGEVNDVAFSPNGQMVVSGGNDRTIRYWNAGDGKSQGVVGAHGGAVRQIAVHPSGTSAFSVGDDGLLKFWTLPPVATRTLAGSPGDVNALALSADGNQVLTAGADKVVRGYTFASGALSRTLAGAADALTSVSMLPNGSLTAAGASRGQWVLWDAKDNKLLAQPLAHSDGPVEVALQPQGSQLLSGGADGNLKTWRLPTLPPVTLAHPDKILAIAMTPDGKRLFTGGTDRILRSFDTFKQNMDRQYAGSPGPVTALAVAPGSGALASGGADGTIRLWDHKTSMETSILGADVTAVTGLGFLPGDNQLLSTHAGGAVKLWQLGGQAVKPLVHVDQVTCVAASLDGSRLITGCADKRVRVWNITTGTKDRELTGPELPIVAVALSPDTATIAAAAADKTLTLWKTTDGTVLHKVVFSAVPICLAISPDNKTIAVGLADGTLHLVDTATGKTDKSPVAHKGPIASVIFVAAGELLTASVDQTVELWELTAPTSRVVLNHGAPITGLAMTRDSKRIAILGGGKLTLREAGWWKSGGKDDGGATVKMEGKAIAFSADGQLVAVTGEDRQARVYGQDGKLWELFSHEGAVTGAVFLDSKRLVTVAADKTAQIRNVAVLWRSERSGPIHQLALSPKGDLFFTAAGPEVQWARTADGTTQGSAKLAGSEPLHLALVGDASRWVAVQGRQMTFWKTATSPDAKGPNLVPISTTDLPAKAIGVACSPNGQRVAVSFAEGTPLAVRVLDLADGRVLQDFAEGQARFDKLSFAADNRSLFGVSGKTVRLFDASVDIVMSAAHPGGVTAVQYQPNGTVALSAGKDGTVKIWDIVKGNLAKSFGPLPGSVRAAAYYGSFTRIAAAAGKKIHIWDLANGKELTPLTHPADVNAMAFSFDQSRLATAGADGITRVWDLASGLELQFFPQSGPVRAVAFHNDNRSVISAAAGKEPAIDVVTATRVVKVDSGPMTALAFSANASQLFIPADKQIVQWNTGNGQRERAFPVSGPVTAIAVAKTNNLLATADANKKVEIFNLGDGKLLGAFSVPANVTNLAFSGSGSALAASCDDGTVQVVQTTMQPGQPLPASFLKPLQTFKHGKAGTGAAFAADNVTLLASSLDGKLVAWKLATDTPVRQFGHPNAITCVGFPADGVRVVTGAGDGKIRIFDRNKGDLLKEINAHPAPNATAIYSIAFRPNVDQVASAGFDGAARIWDMGTGKLVRELRPYRFLHLETPGHHDSVYALAFSPDGKFLATGSAGLENLIKIWDLQARSVRDLVNPQEKQPPGFERSHPGWIYGLAWTKDAKYLVSAGVAPRSHGYIGLWEPLTGKLVRGEQLPLGAFFSLALMPGDRTVLVGAGTRGKSATDVNKAYILKLPLP